MLSNYLLRLELRRLTDANSGVVAAIGPIAQPSRGGNRWGWRRRRGRSPLRYRLPEGAAQVAKDECNRPGDVDGSSAHEVDISAGGEGRGAAEGIKSYQFTRAEHATDCGDRRRRGIQANGMDPVNVNRGGRTYLGGDSGCWRTI